MQCLGHLAGTMDIRLLLENLEHQGEIALVEIFVGYL